MVRFPKQAGLVVGGAVAVEGPRAEKRTLPRPADGMGAVVAAPKVEHWVAPQGNSLLERTQRYLVQGMRQNEAVLAPLVAQLQANGWFSPETLTSLRRSTSKDEAVELIRSSPALASLGEAPELEKIAGEIAVSPLDPSTVLILSMSRRTTRELAGAVSEAAQGPLREIIFAGRHLENLSSFVAAGYTRFTSADQMEAELKSGTQAGVKALFEALAPVTREEIRAAQLEYRQAGFIDDRAEREGAQKRVLDHFTKTMSRMPAPLWAELEQRGDQDVRWSLETLLRREPYGSDLEKANELAALWLTNGAQGAPLHALLSAPLYLDYFMRGGFISDAVLRSTELWS